MKKYTVIANSRGPHFPQIKKAVATVNGLQDYFNCQLVARNDILSASADFIDSDALSAKISKAFGNKPVIALTEEFYEYISEERLPKHVFVTCDDWNEGDQPPLRLFLLYSLASALITLESGIPNKKNEAMSHEPAVGCIFEWWDNSKILRVDFVAARLCGPCRIELEPHLDHPKEAMNATEKILEFVRRAVIGKQASSSRSCFHSAGAAIARTRRSKRRARYVSLWGYRGRCVRRSCGPRSKIFYSHIDWSIDRLVNK